MKKRGVVFAVVVSGFAVACTIMNGLELPSASTPGDGGPVTGNKDTGTQADGAPVRAPDAAPGCVLNHPPPKPAPAGGTDTPVGPEMALAEMVSTNTGSAPAGYDLDNLCTCTGTPPDPPPCITKGSTPCDFNNNGTDNAGNNLNKNLNGEIDPVGDSNQRIVGGSTGFLFRVQQYNQQPNDDAIQVTIFRSKGVVDSNGVDFSRKETWPMSARSAVSTQGWVNGNKLVAYFDSVEVPFLDSVPNPAKLQHAILTGDVVPDANNGGVTVLGAVLTGRVATNEIIASVGQLFAPNFGGYVCQGGQLYGAFGSATCLVQDINIDPNADKAGTAACDALSLAITMTLVPAAIIPSMPIPQPDDNCGGVTPIQCQ